MSPGRHGRHRSRVPARAVTPRVIALGALIAVTCTMGVVGVVGASAATLGGVTTSDFAAASAPVAIHTSGITATWSALASGTTWNVNNVTLTAPAGDTFATGETVRVALISASGSELCEFGATLSSPVNQLSLGRVVIRNACGSAGVAFSSVDRVAISAVR